MDDFGEETAEAFVDLTAVFAAVFAGHLLITVVTLAVFVVVLVVNGIDAARFSVAAVVGTDTFLFAFFLTGRFFGNSPFTEGMTERINRFGVGVAASATKCL